jgi:hypothetical protein
MVEVYCGVMRAGVASRRAEERIVASQAVHRQRLEGICAHATTPIGLGSRSDSTVRGGHVLDDYVFSAGAPNPDAIVTGVLDMAVLKRQAIHGTMNIETVGTRVHRDQIID